MSDHESASRQISTRNTKETLLYAMENRNIISFDQVFGQPSGFPFKKNRVFATGDMGQDDLL